MTTQSSPERDGHFGDAGRFERDPEPVDRLIGSQLLPQLTDRRNLHAVPTLPRKNHIAFPMERGSSNCRICVTFFELQLDLRRPTTRPASGVFAVKHHDRLPCEITASGCERVHLVDKN